MSTLLDIGIAQQIEALEPEAALVLPKTGSWQNCTTSTTSTDKVKEVQQQNHPDSDFVTISCTNIHYRVPQQSINNIIDSNNNNNNNYNPNKKESIIIGVLSGAGGTGPSKRNSIRSTWAYRRQNVFFIVAGPWDDIQYEYNKFNDLLWIDKDEIYITETSVLTYKTESFVNVMYDKFVRSSSSSVASIEYLFKADDDSYVDIEKLYRALLKEEDHESIDYWGKCNEAGMKPHREKSNKWYISYDIYPEPEYPAYCQGAGIAMSKKFLDCAVGSNHGSDHDAHISKIRYQPNEDVALGMLAERCNIEITHDDRVLIRYSGEITMHKKIIQHYVKTEEDMRSHHQCVTGVKGPRLD
jgi:hypothetical protein